MSALVAPKPPAVLGKGFHFHPSGPILALGQPPAEPAWALLGGGGGVSRTTGSSGGGNRKSSELAIGPIPGNFR